MLAFRNSWSTIPMTSSSGSWLSFLTARQSARRLSSWKPSAGIIHRLKNSSMPRLKLTLPLPSTPWTKVPNVLLDQLLPTLKDTELRVILLLIRQTSGWNREDRAVLLTYNSLMRRTGRKSEALSLALRSLKQRGLIHSVHPFAHQADRKAVAGYTGNRRATLYRKRYKDSEGRPLVHHPDDLLQRSKER